MTTATEPASLCGVRLERNVLVEVHSRATRDRNLYSGKVTIDGRPMLERSWWNF